MSYTYEHSMYDFVNDADVSDEPEYPYKPYYNGELKPYPQEAKDFFIEELRAV